MYKKIQLFLSISLFRRIRHIFLHIFIILRGFIETIKSRFIDDPFLERLYKTCELINGKTFSKDFFEGFFLFLDDFIQRS